MVVNVNSIVEGCDTNDQGAVVRDLLASNLKAGKDVVLDFSNVFNVTSSFVNTAFVDLFDEHSVDEFKKHVKLKNLSKQSATLIRSRVATAVLRAC